MSDWKKEGFRPLRADEIECRVARSVPNVGVQLLLYKDARVDQNILDEAVGPLNWQRQHTRENANCVVSIWDADKGQWVSKEDTGTESNTEKEKGLASDSFKRACFNWGIGRELYTSPDIFVYEGKFELNKKGQPKDRFYVADIQVETTGLSKRIVKLAIAYNGKVVFNTNNYTQEELRTIGPVATSSDYGKGGQGSYNNQGNSSGGWGNSSNNTGNTGRWS